MDKLHGEKLFSKIDIRISSNSNEGIRHTKGCFQMPLWSLQVCCHALVLVFFNDILIYSKTWKEKLHNLEVVLKFLHDQSLFAKLSKCEFGLRNFCIFGTSLVNMV